MVHSISGGKAEVIELSLLDSSRIVGKSIKDIQLPGQTLILSVTRNNEDIIPSGDLILQEGDYIIVIAHKEAVSKIEEILVS
jgi:trk system potassium uptake protein TrkA